MIVIVPEIGVFIDMDELESWLYQSLSHCINPEVEGMIVIVEDEYLW